MHTVRTDPLEVFGQALLGELLNLFEEERVTVRLDANDPRDEGRPQVTDHRCVGVQSIQRGDHAQVRMVLTKLRQKPFQCVAFAVVFCFAILLQDRFGHQRDDFLLTGTDQRGTKHLMVVGDRAVFMVFFHALGAM